MVIIALLKVSTEAVLFEYPPLFSERIFYEGKRSGPSQLELEREYLNSAQKF